MRSVEDAVSSVLAAAHPRLRERCSESKIISVLEDDCGAYDIDDLQSVLETGFDTVVAKLEQRGAAPLAFVTLLKKQLVNGAEATGRGSSSADAGSGQPGADQQPAQRAGDEQQDAPRSAPEPAHGKQVSVASLFGSGKQLQYERLPTGQRVLASVTDMTQDQLKELPEATIGQCVKGCGQYFSHAPAKVAHEKVCKGGSAGAARAAAEIAAAQALAAGVSSEAAALFSAAAATAAAAAATSDDEAPRRPGKDPIPRKSDGRPKQTGLRPGDKRVPRTLYYKLEIVKTLRRFEQLQKLGLCPYPNQATTDAWPGVLKGDVTKYGKAEAELRKALTHEHHVARKQKNRQGTMAAFKSRAARQVSLHPGRTVPFAAAETELHAGYRAKRRGGERVSGQWLRISMKRLVREFYGDDAADGFKASKLWLRQFARRFGISLRRKSNAKAEPVEMRLPKIKRWHARLRRRLKRGGAVHPVYGRWLPRNRLSHDQVGINLRNGLQSTYDEKGSTRVWIAGSPADDGKRIATLNITARAVCDDSKPRRAQPKMSITLRGQGKQISDVERAGWHPDVQVRFQKKAWADDELCEEVARVEIAEATEDARAAGEESVTFFDNLSGQTTAEHKRLLKKHAKSARHLLPTSSTGELMHIDDGIGARMKVLMGEETDAWLEQPGNLERWTTGPKQGGLKAWEKRVLLTQFAGRAWEKLCATYDFEASARRLGLLMTIDGTRDDEIQIQGLTEKYIFTDADGGSEGAESEADEDEADLADVNEDVDEEEDDEEAEDAMEESDEEDDTAERMAACGEAPPTPPSGFVYAASCPSLVSLDDKAALIGCKVLTAHLEDGACGWFVGTVVSSVVGKSWKKTAPRATHLIEYKEKETKTRKLVGKEATELSFENYGAAEWWLLLEPIG